MSDSAKSKFPVLIFDGTQPPAYFLEHQDNMWKVITGLGAADDCNLQVTYMREMLKGVPLTAFNRRINRELAHGGLITKLVVDEAIREVTKMLFKSNAAALQRRAMRTMRKRKDWTIRQHVNRLLEINEEMKNLPLERNGQIPTNLSDLALIELVEDGIPKEWLDKMQRQKFVPIVEGLDKTVDFCERLEMLELTVAARKPNATRNEQPQSRKAKRKTEHFAMLKRAHDG